jgi:hypothetical protein
MVFLCFYSEFHWTLFCWSYKFPVFDWILPFSLEHLVAWNPDFLPACLAPTGAGMHHRYHNLQEWG